MSRDSERRVVVLALNGRPAPRVIDYTHFLLSVGVDVDLVVVDQDSPAELGLDPRVRVHPIMPSERRHPLRRAEWLLAYRLPGALLARGRRFAGASRARPLADAVATLERGHRRVADGFHHRVFWPVYRGLRPWLLARRARRPLRGLDVAGADRIVAADPSAVTLGWRLARRHRNIVATTLMDRASYAAAGGSDGAGK